MPKRRRCFDSVTIADNFAKYFESVYSCNNPGQAGLLKIENLEMRRSVIPAFHWETL